jgi:hypothetical protein
MTTLCGHIAVQILPLPWFAPTSASPGGVRPFGSVRGQVPGVALTEAMLPPLFVVSLGRFSEGSDPPKQPARVGMTARTLIRPKATWGLHRWPIEEFQEAKAGTLPEGRRRADWTPEAPSARNKEKVRLLVLAVLLTALASGACSNRDAVSVTRGAREPSASGLVPASAELLGKCRATANEVGYPVPCPTRMPTAYRATRAIGGCELDIIGPGGIGGCSKAWRGWVVGSSETSDQHLVVVASPRALRNDAKVVNGPAWYPGARVRPLRSLTINGWRVRAVYVPAETNDGSAFARHVVLVWTVAGHTYGVGFHNAGSLRQTMDLDAALVRGIRLVAPADS